MPRQNGGSCKWRPDCTLREPQHERGLGPMHTRRDTPSRSEYFVGTAREAVLAYSQNESTHSYVYENTEPDRSNHSLVLHRAGLRGGGDQYVDAIACGENATFALECQARSPFSILEVSLGVYDFMGSKVRHLTNVGRQAAGEGDARKYGNDHFVVTCQFSISSLAPSTYRVNVHLSCDGLEVAYLKEAFLFNTVLANSRYGTVSPAELKCPVILPQQWSAEARN